LRYRLLEREEWNMIYSGVKSLRWKLIDMIR
jgi:hypothetical protein